MAVLKIPLRSDFDSYTFTIDLEGLTYGFKFYYNGRISKWFFDLNDSIGNPIIAGIPVYVNQLSLKRFQTPLKPPGDLIFFDTSGKQMDPTQDDLGSRVILGYSERGKK